MKLPQRLNPYKRDLTPCLCTYCGTNSEVCYDSLKDQYLCLSCHDEEKAQYEANNALDEELEIESILFDLQGRN